MAIEIVLFNKNASWFPLKIRFLDNNGLDKYERNAINSIVKGMGYKDANDLAKRGGYFSVREMTEDHAFENVADFFLGEGWYRRLAPFRIKD